MSLEQGRELDPSQNQNTGLDTCPDCGGSRLQADEFERVAEGVWFGYMECPDCDWSKTRVLDKDAIDELDEVLDERAREVDKQLNRMVEENMQETIGVFAASAAADQIFPEDIARL